MRKTYKSSKELEGNILQEGDVLEFFQNITYTTFESFLNHYLDNNTIFDFLNIDNKCEFCNKYYGYESYDNGFEKTFPESVDYDYEALTRVAIALFKECEKIVTFDNCKIGDKVILSKRKKSYRYPNIYIHYYDKIGEIIKIKLTDGGEVVVKWSNTEEYWYSIGYKGKYELDFYQDDNNKELINVKSINENSNEYNKKGNIIKVQRLIGTIREGERIRGTRISGRTGKTTITIRHLSNKTISC